MLVFSSSSIPISFSNSLYSFFLSLFNNYFSSYFSFSQSQLLGFIMLKSSPPTSSLPLFLLSLSIYYICISFFLQLVSFFFSSSSHSLVCLLISHVIIFSGVHPLISLYFHQSFSLSLNCWLSYNFFPHKPIHFFSHSQLLHIITAIHLISHPFLSTSLSFSFFFSHTNLLLRLFFIRSASSLSICFDFFRTNVQIFYLKNERCLHNRWYWKGWKWFSFTQS